MFAHRHLLGIEQLSAPDILEILDLADGYVALGRQRQKNVEKLRGLTQINLFFENSTRTQASFELAGKRLGADVIRITSYNVCYTKLLRAFRDGQTLQFRGGAFR